MSPLNLTLDLIYHSQLNFLGVKASSWSRIASCAWQLESDGQSACQLNDDQQTSRCILLEYIWAVWNRHLCQIHGRAGEFLQNKVVLTSKTAIVHWVCSNILTHTKLPNKFVGSELRSNCCLEDLRMCMVYTCMVLCTKLLFIVANPKEVWGYGQRSWSFSTDCSSSDSKWPSSAACLPKGQG